MLLVSYTPVADDYYMLDNGNHGDDDGDDEDDDDGDASESQTCQRA